MPGSVASGTSCINTNADYVLGNNIKIVNKEIGFDNGKGVELV
jgi:hypothetical protein